METLGMLAIVGILSVGGLEGYRIAMDRYRANELLNEALKRAIILATKAMSGRKIDNGAMGEFWGLPDADRFSVTHDEAHKQFTLTVSGVDNAVCHQMQNIAGTEGTIQKLECDTDNLLALITFNDDLSDKKALFGISSADGPENDDGSDCSNDSLAESNECQVCFGGSYIDSNAMCQKLYPNEVRICVEGQCIVPEDSELGGCTYNSNCVGEVDGINCDQKICFCDYYDPDRDWGDDTPGGIRSGDRTPDAGSGVCKEATYRSLTVENDGIAGMLSTISFDWFSAKNFCAALGRRMVSTTDLGITPSKLGSFFEENAYCFTDYRYATDEKMCKEVNIPEKVVNGFTGGYLGTFMWTKSTYPYLGDPLPITVGYNDISLNAGELADPNIYLLALCVR